MPRTREQLQQAVADTEVWLERLDPEALEAPDAGAAEPASDR